MAFCGRQKYGEHYKDHFETGVYVCVNCGSELFSSLSKYEHDSPWPAFDRTVKPDSVSKVNESSWALKVSCGKCKNPLGHEFLEESGSRF